MVDDPLESEIITGVGVGVVDIGGVIVTHFADFLAVVGVSGLTGVVGGGGFAKLVRDLEEAEGESK